MICLTIAHEAARRSIMASIANAPLWTRVSIGAPTRSADQNAALHAVLTDIAKQVSWHGQKLSVDVWKRLCTAAWLREKNEQPMMIPALDGKGFDVIFEKTSKLSLTQCSELIEWCFAFGAEHDVKFSAGKMVADDRQ